MIGRRSCACDHYGKEIGQSEDLCRKLAWNERAIGNICSVTGVLAHETIYVLRVYSDKAKLHA